jgi:hypothetical protein
MLPRFVSPWPSTIRIAYFGDMQCDVNRVRTYMLTQAPTYVHIVIISTCYLPHGSLDTQTRAD